MKKDKNELFRKQMDIFYDELSKTVEEITERCIESDGEVLPQSVAIGIGKTLGACLGAVTAGVSDKVADEIIELAIEIVKETTKMYRADFNSFVKGN